ncbi:unnamed protein product [Paramecium sonneborni]|uniref:Thioredoxin domain-containing protein n=1 Tax=Paramecium sonneborni TaxID=65129 RepID=A0A8S1RIL6_9CILI|nr:unnamed protein product [Paramecium sonneborni]
MQQVIQVTTSNYCEKVNKEGKAALIFVGDILDLTGQSWCSDTVEAEPIIKNYAIPELQQRGYQIYWCWGGDKETWYDQNNPARNSQWIKIREVPTLLLIHDNKEVIRFEEEQLFTEKELKQYLEQQ